MIRRGRKLCLLAAISCSWCAGAWGQESGSASSSTSAPSSTKVKLSLFPLPSGATVLCGDRPSQDASSLRIGGINNGVLVPDHRIHFQHGDGPQSIELGENQLPLAWDGTTRFVLRTGAADKALGKVGTGLESAGVILKGDQKYVLAFPQTVAINNKEATVWYRSGSVQQATTSIGGQTISFYDANADGAYTLEDDGFFVGRLGGGVSVFAPISKYFATAQGVFEIRSLAKDGSSFEYAKAPGKAEKLSFGFASNDGDAYLAVGSKDADLNCVVAAGPRGRIEGYVLPGTYHVLYGIVYSASLNRAVAMLEAASTEDIQVTGGKPAALQLGAPFKLDFTVTMKDAGNFAISPASFKLQGKSGEIYTNFKWQVGKPPAVGIADGAAVKRVGQMAFG